MTAIGSWQVGEALPVGGFAVDREDLARYAQVSGDHNPIHWDQCSAVRAGMPDVVAPGLLLTGLALAELTHVLGGAAALAGYTARFLRPLPVPADTAARVDVAGTVYAVHAGLAQVRLTLGCPAGSVAVIDVDIAGPRTSDRPPTPPGAECREEAS